MRINIKTSIKILLLGMMVLLQVIINYNPYINLTSINKDQDEIPSISGDHKYITVYSEDFNSISPGEKPTGWDISDNPLSNQIRVIDPNPDTSFLTNSLLITDSESVSNVSGSLDFITNVTSGTLQFDLNVYIVGGIQHSYFLHLDDEGDNHIITIEISVQDPLSTNWTLKVESQTVGTYNHQDELFVEIVISNYLIDVFINESLVLTDIEYSEGEIAGLKVQSTDAGYGSEVFIDNILFQEIFIWNLTGTPISIDDLNPAKNWSYTVDHYDWCSGSGTWSDPYIIENVLIDGLNSGSCIEIYNSNSFFIIKNCNLTNCQKQIFSPFHGGILLINVNNSRLINNTCFLNNGQGISIENSHNNTLIDNKAYQNDVGIFLYTDCSKNNIIDCTTYFNSIGIYLLSTGQDNIILGNIAYNNTQTGITISYSNFNEIEGNTLSNGSKGIYVAFSNEDIITGNNINNNFYGIHLFFSNNNTIMNNDLYNNNECIYEQNCTVNIILNNNCHEPELPEPIIPGYNILFMICIIFVIIISIKKKIKK